MPVQLDELLDRKYYQGTKITNCITHMNLDITKRPDDCHLCLTDLRNHMHTAIRTNEWLNKWKNDAEEMLKTHLLNN